LEFCRRRNPGGRASTRPDGPAYQAALEVFNHIGARDFRIIEALE
jgi:hypothetical protein